MLNFLLGDDWRRGETQIYNFFGVGIIGDWTLFELFVFFSTIWGFTDFLDFYNLAFVYEVFKSRLERTFSDLFLSKGIISANN